jgi:beta-lactamase regulating signal transducer with metallopeptidase domain
MNAAADFLTESLMSVSLQVSILIAIIWFVSLFAKRASSEFCYLLWCIVLLRLCIPVGFNLPFLPSLNTGQLIVHNYQVNTKTDDLQIQNGTDATVVTNTAGVAGTAIKEPAVSHETGTIMPDYRLIAFILWFSGVLLISAITVSRNLLLLRKLNKCPTVQREELNNLLANLCRRLRVRQIVSLHYMDTTVFSGPVASGTIKPKIFLPSVMADTWSVEETEPVLLHELAHIKRHDSFVNLIQMITQIVYFFHPLVWFVNSRINTIREEACDDMAIGYLEGATDRYSVSILNVIGFMRNEKSYGLAGFGFAEIRSSLGKRMKRILNDGYRLNRKLSKISIAVLVFIGIVGVAVAGAKKSESIQNIINVAARGDVMIKSGMGNIDKEYAVVDSASIKRIEILNKQAKESVKNNPSGVLAVLDVILTHSKSKFFFGFEGNKLRLNEEMSEPKGIVQRTWDGEKSEYLSDINGETLGVIDKDKKIGTSPINYDPQYYGFYIYGHPVAKFLKDKKIQLPPFDIEKKIRIENISFVGEERIEDIECDVFKGYDKSNGVSLKVWLGKSILYRPKHIEVISSDHKVITDNTFQKFSNGIIYPKKTIRKFYGIENNKEILHSVQTIIIDENFKVNIDVPDSVFAIQFPKGLKVQDSRFNLLKALKIKI